VRPAPRPGWTAADLELEVAQRAAHHVVDAGMDPVAAEAMARAAVYGAGTVEAVRGEPEEPLTQGGKR
jgi:hypothetical protein